ncbi:inositol transport system ATP-binding protein [Lachnospiraceae bacterium PF1-21]|uniref:sugar ABC transporter ATP-binding protein n=1 Tax=Ohessyouella blattaphilus TaxID=2949333 RepID=UPI003E289408
MLRKECLLEMCDIVKEFPGVKALDGVNLKVQSGEVHVICGENGAGKSTLMKIINGTYTADSGQMYFKGEEIGSHDVQDTLEMGIAMIYQELNPVLDMTIAENVYLGREPLKGKFVDFKKMYSDTQSLLDSLEIPYDAKQKMSDLSLAGHQLVEIAKAISVNASLIIMDEPSSAIGDEEIEVLFKQIFALKEKGVGIVYITHKMDEIFKIADRITVIRDGQWIITDEAPKLNPDLLIKHMVGREISNVFPKDDTIEIGEVVLKVEHLTQAEADGGRFKDISFEIRAGEILGFAGLVGAGRSEVMRAIFGLDAITSGDIYLGGEKMNISCTQDAVEAGIAMINEDRRGYGLVLGSSICSNISLVNLNKYTNKAFVNDKLITEDSKKMMELLKIKAANKDVVVGNLSGGNQQKVVLAKWLVGDVKVLILDEPTRGIDVGAKSEIHKLMCDFARQGMAIIMISSELPEILGMSDRVVVMQEGRISGTLNKDELTQERTMKLATKGRER